MAYKAIKQIGEYKIGDTVPEEQALIWLSMFKEPHVEKVENSFLGIKKKTKEEVPEEKSSALSTILKDYLERNQSVVKKNLLEDPLNKEQLKELLQLEWNDKRRPLVVNTLKQLLNGEKEH